MCTIHSKKGLSCPTSRNWYETRGAHPATMVKYGLTRIQLPMCLQQSLLNPCYPEGFLKHIFLKGVVATPFWIINTEGHITLNVAPNTPLRMPNWYYNFVTLYVLSLRYLTPKWLTNLTRWSKFLWFNTVMIIVDTRIHESNYYSSLWLATWFKLGHNRS